MTKCHPAVFILSEEVVAQKELFSGDGKKETLLCVDLSTLRWFTKRAGKTLFISPEPKALR